MTFGNDYMIFLKNFGIFIELISISVQDMDKNDNGQISIKLEMSNYIYQNK